MEFWKYFYVNTFNDILYKSAPGAHFQSVLVWMIVRSACETLPIRTRSQASDWVTTP